MTHATCRLTAKNQDQLWNPSINIGYLYLFASMVCTVVVCLGVTRLYCFMMAKHLITETVLHDSPQTVIF